MPVANPRPLDRQSEQSALRHSAIEHNDEKLT